MEARPPAFSLASRINQDGPFYGLESANLQESAGRGSGEAHDVVETLGGTETGRAGADDKNVDITAYRPSMTRFPRYRRTLALPWKPTYPPC